MTTNENLELNTDPTDGSGAGTSDIAEQAQIERQTRQEWEITYRQMTPAPVLREDSSSLEVNWWKSYGWAFLIVIFCLGLFIAARTGKGIYDANVAEGFKRWSLPLTFAAIIGIEGLIIVFGFFRPRQIDTSKFETLLEKSYSWLSVVIGLFISAASGMKFFISTFENLQADWGVPIDKSLSLALGVGLTFVLFGISEFAGRLKWIADNTPHIRQHEHDLKVVAYTDALNAAWFDSNEYVLLNQEKLLAREIAQADLAEASKGRNKIRLAKQRAEIERMKIALDAERHAIENPAPVVQERVIVQQVASETTEQDSRPQPSVTALVDQYINANGLSYADDLSAAEIAAKLHVEPGSVRSAISRKRKDLQIVVSNNGSS